MFFSYQNGPDTYLLQVKDSGFPARLREYLNVAKQHSAEFQEVRVPIVKERRRFTDVMDEEAEKTREDRLVVMQSAASTISISNGFLTMRPIVPGLTHGAVTTTLPSNQPRWRLNSPQRWL